VIGVVCATVLVDVGLLVAGFVVARDTLTEGGWGLLGWVVAVAIVGFASVPFDSGNQLGLDMPLLLAAGYLFGPLAAGCVAFAAYFDAREFRGEIQLSRALFNRAQTSLSVMAATVVFLMTGGESGNWPMVALAALLAVGTDILVNYSMVVVVISLSEGISLREGLSRLYFGTPADFALTYASFGLLSLLLAEIFTAIGPWGLAVFAIPILLARQAFSGRRRLEGAQRRASVQLEALRDMSQTIADERKQERLALAAGLHDEVLPPLFKVHLMGEVLKRDLATGRLLTLEEDVPELLGATERASDSMRALIVRLRESPLGVGGLAETLSVLVEYLQAETRTVIELDVDKVSGTPLVQLLAYQVVREALRNVINHSNAKSVRVVILGDQDKLQIEVEDDGTGFAPETVDSRSHFGLALMRERLEIVGGSLRVQSSRGQGTRLSVMIPSGMHTK
jgi:signal transduction histidine kinase